MRVQKEIFVLTLNNSPYMVLILSNDKIQIPLLQLVLESNGFSVCTSTTKINEIQSINQCNPDVIILYSNSSNNEISVCKRIREVSSIPILVLSSMNKTGMVEKTLNAGADEYLIKPISDNILFAHLKTLSRRSRVEKEAMNRLSESV